MPSIGNLHCVVQRLGSFHTFTSDQVVRRFPRDILHRDEIDTRGAADRELARDVVSEIVKFYPLRFVTVATGVVRFRAHQKLRYRMHFPQ